MGTLMSCLMRCEVWNGESRMGGQEYGHQYQRIRDGITV